MDCPKCQNDTHTYDSRKLNNHTKVRRKRECLECGHKFITIETYRNTNVM